jgi:hypothetical protein
MKYSELKSILAGVKGTTFVGLDTKTVPKLKGGKKNPMQGRITKVVTGANTMVFASTDSSGYQSMVHKRMEKEGKDPEIFEVGKRAWGTRVGNSCFIEHKGQYYIEVFYMGAGEVSYFLDNEPIEKDDIEGLNESKPKAESQGGIEDKVVIRTLSVDSITGVRANGQTME